jgi:hypothetical protein
LYDVQRKVFTMSPKSTAALLVLGAVTANAAFLVLSISLGYPDLLAEPPAVILTRFRDHQVVGMLGFALLAGGAALLGPIAVGLHRAARRRGRIALVGLGFGVAAAVVQVVGLSRWLFVVPTLAWRALDPDLARAAADSYASISGLLGTVVGETLGYLCTAVWTVCVALTVTSGRTMRTLAGVSALLIAGGMLVPLDVPGADVGNFVGYVLWSGWLVALAVVLWRGTGQLGRQTTTD